MPRPMGEGPDLLAAIRSLGSIQCGEEAAKSFLHDADYTNLNNGSFGTYPLVVRNVIRQFQDRIEARPDAFIRYEYRARLLAESREALAKYVHVPVDSCVYVPNATTGIDTVLRNMAFTSGDVIVGFATLIAIFDTINSIPGTRMPFERLAELCRSHKVLSCIDGAHGIGHIPLNLAQLDPDFFVSNCHKWLYVPRGCAMLYTPVRNQHLLRATVPTGFGFIPIAPEAEAREPLSTQGRSKYVVNFADLGTKDDTPYLCIKAALEWRSKLEWEGRTGEEAIMDYNQDLARKGGQTVADILGTEVMENAEKSLGRCNFANIRLPLTSAELSRGGQDQAAGIEAWIMEYMTMKHETAVMIFQHGGALWVRLSAQVFLTLLDFERAGAALKATCEMAARGDWELG